MGTKKGRKKERKQQERVEREANEKGEGQSSPARQDHNELSVTSPPPKSGKNTPDVGEPKPGASEGGLQSPATESAGARTPTSRRPARNPWTLFMRLPAPSQEAEIREFFKDAKTGVC